MSGRFPRRARRAAGLARSRHPELTGLAVLDYLYDYADGVHLRPSDATHWDGFLLRRYVPNEPRILADGSYYTEGARTNYVLRSNDITHQGTGPDQWSTGFTVTPIVGPDGLAASGQVITYTTSGQSIIYFHDDTVMPDSTPMAYAAFVRPPVEAGRMLARNKANTTDAALARGSTNGVWGRGTKVFDSGIGTTDPYVRLYAGGVTAGEYGYGGVSLEQAHFASQLIETFGAAATRAADSMVIPQAAMDPRFFTGVTEISVTMGQSESEWDAALGSGYVFAVDTLGQNELLAFLSNGNVALYVNNVFVAQAAGVTWADGDVITFRFNPLTGDLRVITPTQDLFVAGSTASAGFAPNDVAFGTDKLGGQHMFGAIHRAIARDYVLDRPAELFAFADGVHTRPSDATYFDPVTGLLTRYAPNEPRLLGDGSYYSEGARTNLVTTSDDISAWGSGTPVHDAETDPAGGALLADRFDALASGLSFAGASITSGTITSNVDTAASIFVRRNGAWESPYPRIYYTSKDATLEGTPFLDVPLWQRASVIQDSGSGGLSPRVASRQAATSAPWAEDVWGISLEEGSFPSQHIETSGAAATRAGDKMLIPRADVADWLFYRPFSVKIRMAASHDEQAADGLGMEVLHIDGTHRLLFLNSGVFQAYSGALVSSFTKAQVPWDAGDEIEVRFNPANGDLRIITPTTDTFDAGVGATGWVPGDLYVGSITTGAVAMFGATFPPTPIDSVT